MTDARAVVSAIFAGVVAYSFLNALPAVLEVIAADLHWDDRALGVLASAGLAGITIGGIIGVPIIRRFGIRTVVLSGLICFVGAHLISGTIREFRLIVSAQFFAGVCGGVITAGCFAIYSHSRPQRNFGAFMVGQMIFAWAAVSAVPSLATIVGWRSPFYVLAGFAACVLPLAFFLPAATFHAANAVQGERPAVLARHAPWIGVIAATIYTFGASPVWTFLARIGIDSGISTAQVNFAIACCTIAGLAGAVVSMLPGRSSGTTWSIIAGVVFALAALYAVRSHNPITYTVAICIFMFSWPILNAALFAAVAIADTKGTATLSLSPAMSASFALGPLIGGELIARHGFQSLQLLGLVGALAPLLCLLPSGLARNAAVASGHE